MHTAMTPAIGIPASLIERISYTAIDIGTVGHCGAKQGRGRENGVGQRYKDTLVRVVLVCTFSARGGEVNWFNGAYFGV